MISRTHRFRGHASLARVYQHSRSVRGGAMSLKFVTGGHQTSYRAAVVVSKKVSKSAVKRNRIRRRLYEQIRLLEPEFHMPADLILTVYEDSLLALPAGELTSEVRRLFHQAQLIS